MKIKLTVTALFISFFFLPGAFAKEYIDLAAPAVKRLPVAIEEFKYTGHPPVDSKAAEEIRSIRNELIDTVKSDLEFSNLFTIIGNDSFVEDPTEPGIDEAEMFKRLRAGGADTFIKGSFILEKERLTVEFRFYDSVEGKLVIGKQYTIGSTNPRRLVHYFTDQLYQELTGRKGIFTTKLLFISDRTGNKEVYLADYDGKGAVQITRNKSINLSPQWAPDGRKVLYTSYKKGWPCLFIFDLKTGKDAVVSDKPGINIGGRFSPDGNHVALTLSTEKSPELFLLDLSTREYKRLTDNFGINVSPAWAPDGQKLAYVSDTAGNPNIFMLDLASSNSRRLTHSGKYNSSPVWSSDGKLIAFSRSDGSLFNIWGMEPDGSRMTQLTFEKDNRSPSWSPDNRYLVFSSTSHGVSSLYVMLADGSGLTKLDAGPGNATSPAWSPFLQ